MWRAASAFELAGVFAGGKKGILYRVLGVLDIPKSPERDPEEYWGIA
jgi:hypothetical protein